MGVLHGVPFTAPLGHLREVVEICRSVWRRERLEHAVRHYTIPLPADRGAGLGKPLKLINTPVRESIPIILASITDKAIEQTAEIGNGWLPLFFHPTRSAAAWGDAIDGELLPSGISQSASDGVGDSDGGDDNGRLIRLDYGPDN